MELLVTMMNIFGSPFTCVRFKDFFLADIFTSLVKPFQDIVILELVSFQINIGLKILKQVVHGLDWA
jgi:hypothetical protein